MAMPKLVEHPRIEINPKKLNGTPVVAGTRVPVSSVLVELAAGTPEKEVQQQYNLTAADVRACIGFAAWVVERSGAEAA